MDINIIGGADGPTAIFIASSVNWAMIALLGIIAIAVALLIVVRKRKPRS
ncbi:MAG: hypothetical protein Q8S22_11930 [Eubacteriales bacterium]|jgi:Na+-transporting methylmalonyl-CoA/oxaloacetate decarboxylase beta subunit|nr:hypothetical protein [Eubacteriales bacterium]